MKPDPDKTSLSMKQFSLRLTIIPRSIAVGSFLLCCMLAESAVAQQAREVIVSGPKAQGSQEYLFQSTAPGGALAVFRRDVYRDDKLIDRYEVINEVPPGSHFQKVVSITSSGIKVDDANMDLPLNSHRTAINFRSEPNCLKTVFQGVKNSKPWAVTYIFTMRNEPVEDVLRRAPKKASLQMRKLEATVNVTGWTWGLDYSNISSPMTAGLGDLE
jgi:hypothetical protein